MRTRSVPMWLFSMKMKKSKQPYNNRNESRQSEAVKRAREGAEAVSEDRRSVRNKSAPPNSTASRYDVGGDLEREREREREILRD